MWLDNSILPIWQTGMHIVYNYIHQNHDSTTVTISIAIMLGENGFIWIRILCIVIYSSNVLRKHAHCIMNSCTSLIGIIGIRRMAVDKNADFTSKNLTRNKCRSNGHVVKAKRCIQTSRNFKLNYTNQSCSRF